MRGNIGPSVLPTLDIQTAQSRLRQARLQYNLAAADAYPSLSGALSASRQETDTASSEQYRAGLDARWELDIFGGIRRGKEAALAQTEASEADLQDVMTSLLADVALNYVEMRVYQNRIKTTEASLANQQDTLDLTRWRAQSGLVTQLDVEQALYATEQMRAALPVLQNNLQAAFYRIAVLVGQQPGSLDARLKQAAEIPAVPAALMLDIPAESLRQRPDVRKAERLLAAQTAQIGVAEAARYPSFSLSGFIGSDARSAGDLFTTPTQLASIAGSIAMPLFNAGKLKRQQEIQEELRQQSWLNYQTTVLAALEESENALSRYASEQEHQAILQRATLAAKNASELAQQQYEAGLADFQVVLSTQRAYLTLQDDLNVSNGQILSNTIRLYKALGGGWLSNTSLESATHEE